jgi:hypothetical protein
MDLVEKYLNEKKYFNWKLFYQLAKSKDPKDIDEFYKSEIFMNKFNEPHIQKALSFSGSFTQFMKYKAKSRKEKK